LRFEHLRTSAWIISLTPLFGLPLLFQHILTHSYFDAQGQDALFSLQHFKEHFLEFLKTHMDFSYAPPYPIILHWLAAGLLARMLIRSAFAQKPLFSVVQKQFTSIVAACFVANLAVMLSLYWTNVYTHPASARFFLPSTILCALFPVVCAVMGKANGRRNSWLLLLTSVVMVLLYYPVALEGRFTNSFILKRETDFAYEVIGRQSDKNILIIAGRPGQFTALDYGAVDFPYADREAAVLRTWLENHLCREIWVIQRIAYATHQPLADDRLDPAFVLATLAEEQTSAESFVRISKVERILQPPSHPLRR